MNSIYTKKGDGGETSLMGGERVSKDSIKVECYGTIDEANSMIGLAKALSKDELIIEYLEQIQKKLFIVASELASTEKAKKILKEKIEEKDVLYLENIIDKCTLLLGKQNEFTTPGVDMLSATLHISRTIVRRSERHITKLNKIEDLNSNLVKYINRLSDCIYILARYQEERYLINLIKEKVLEKVNGMVNKLDIELAKKMAELAEKKSKKIKVPIVFSVVDDGGNLILLHKIEGTLLASTDISINKAYTANALKMPTHELYELAQPGKPLYGIEATNQGKIVLFGGGYPLKIDDKIVGAIGISGGSVEEDMEIAEYVLDNIRW
ncbi:MAG: cob(I)yrinic acid a,c-diamide adenosyltransferase [Bacillota bacterium]|nr:cob(I)yrinic acid a,c-diamide adenosyltransferase [Bacillota bacterium]